MKIKWLEKTKNSNYLAAASYLNLLYNTTTVEKLVNRLKASPIISFKAKDIFRASRLPLLGSDNYHVQIDYKKIKKGILISPLLLVRDEKNATLIIADGYHRLCAIYSLSEDAPIHCQII